MTQILKIDSALRVNPSTTNPSDCVIPCNEVLSGKYALRAIMLPVTYHNVHAGNNTIYWTDTGGARTANLTSGYYSSKTALATEMATVMTAAGAGTVTYTIDNRTQILTVSNTVAFSFTFGTNTTNSAASMMGFIGNSLAAALSQTATKLINLSETLTYNFNFSDSNSGVRTMNGQGYTFCIPAIETTPSLMYYEPPVHFPITFTLTPTQALCIRIYDDKNRIINNMRSDFFMMLEKIGV